MSLNPGEIPFVNFLLSHLGIEFGSGCSGAGDNHHPADGPVQSVKRAGPGRQDTLALEDVKYGIGYRVLGGVSGYSGRFVDGN